MQATDNQAKGEQGQQDGPAEAAGLGLGFDAIASLVDETRDEVRRCGENEAQALRAASRARQLADFLQKRAADAMRFIHDPDAFRRIMAGQWWDGMLFDFLSDRVSREPQSDADLAQELWDQAAEKGDQPARPALFRRSDGVTLFLGPDNHPAIEGLALVKAVRRVLGVPARGKKPEAKSPKAGGAADAKWRQWLGSYKSVLKDGLTGEAEALGRQWFLDGRKPGEAAKMWLGRETGRKAATPAHAPPPSAEFDPAQCVGPEAVGGGAYTAADFRDAVSMASVKKGLVKRVFEHNAGAYAVVETERSERGDVERFRLRQLVPPAHWKDRTPRCEAWEERAMRGAAELGYVGLAVHDPEPRAWVIGERHIDVEVRGAGEDGGEA